MADRHQKVVLNVGGGWATDFGPVFTGAPQGNALTLPFLLNAENVVYELDGGPHKVGGADRLNSAAITGGSVHGMIDVWFQGTAGSETQKRFCYAGTRLLKEDVDGTWDELTTGLENNKEPCFEVFTDLVIWASTSTVDVPRTWDGAAATTSVLGGSPPNFAFHRKHKNRVWAAGVAGNPSRLYYCASTAPSVWTGADAGAFDIDPDDGDRIVGLASHKNELLVFKGPHRLSIHRITGSSPSGADAFARIPFVTGVGGINHNTIFTVNDDLAFASPRGLHSLAATANYGDYVEAFLARPILSYYQDDLNHSVLNTAWGVNYQARGLAVWTFAASGGTAKNRMLVYDYRFQPGRWALWSNATGYVAANCLAIFETSTRKHRLFAGRTDGFVYELDRSTRTVATGNAYTMDVKTPFLNFGTSAHGKSLDSTFHSFSPKGNYSYTFGWTRDTNVENTATVAQGGVSDTLG